MKKISIVLLALLLLGNPMVAFCEEDSLIMDETPEETVEVLEEETEAIEETVTEEEPVVEQVEEVLLESGSCGPNATYKIYPDYSMVIEGEGAIDDYTTKGISSLYSKVTSVKVSEGITRIGAFAFYRFGMMTKIELPESLLSIGSNAFNTTTRLKSIYIPASVEDMAGKTAKESPFYYAPATLQIYAGSDGSSWNQYATNRTTSGKMKVTYNATRTDSQFWPYVNQKAAYVDIPDGVTIIPNNAFYKNTTLKEVNIPDSVSYIGDNAFYYCTNLKSISGLPSNLKYLGSYAFWHCYKLTGHIEIPEGITEIKDKTFANCEKITSVSIPSSVERINYYAFEDCFYLSRVEFGEDSKLEYIGQKAFRQCCQLRFLYIPSTIKVIEGPAANVDLCPFICDNSLELFMAIDGPLPGFDAKWNYGVKNVHYSSSYSDYKEALSNSAYTLHYDGNGADNLAEYSVNALYGSGVCLGAELFQRAGYSFMGYATNPEGTGTLYKAGSTFTVNEGEPNGDFTVYAVWRALPNTITYRPNGGRPVSKNPQRYSTGDDMAINPCYKKGYRFLGWFDNPAGTGEPYVNVNQCIGRVTLYALYEMETYSITIDPIGGVPNGIQKYDDRLVLNDDIYSGFYNILSTIYRLPRLVKAGYTFNGWLNLTTNRRIASIPKGSAGNYDIVAVYTPINYRITYVNGGGRIKPYSIYSKNYNILTDVVILPDENMITKAGYTFAGWYTNKYFAEDTLVTSFDTSVLKNVTLYAKWVKN